MERRLRQLLDGTFEVVTWIQGALLVGIVMLVFGQVVFRQLFSVGAHWLYELAAFFQVSLVFIGAPVLVHNRSNVAISALTDAVSPRRRKQLYLVTMLSIAFCSVLMVVSYILYVRRFGWVLTPTLKMPAKFFFISVAIGYALNGLVLVHQTLWYLTEANPAAGDDR